MFGLDELIFYIFPRACVLVFLAVNSTIIMNRFALFGQLNFNFRH